MARLASGPAIAAVPRRAPGVVVGGREERRRTLPAVVVAVHEADASLHFSASAPASASAGGTEDGVLDSVSSGGPSAEDALRGEQPAPGLAVEVVSIRVSASRTVPRSRTARSTEYASPAPGLSLRPQPSWSKKSTARSPPSRVPCRTSSPTGPAAHRSTTRGARPAALSAAGSIYTGACDRQRSSGTAHRSRGRQERRRSPEDRCHIMSDSLCSTSRQQPSRI